jgi:hypothetical protein
MWSSIFGALCINSRASGVPIFLRLSHGIIQRTMPQQEWLNYRHYTGIRPLHSHLIITISLPSMKWMGNW